MVVTGILGSGCRSERRGEPRVETTPVRGVILVDGQPAAGVKVECRPVTPDASLPLIPSAMTDEKGRFAIGTYEQGDGAPPGDYQLVCVWGEFNVMNGSYSGDKLKGRYAKPEKSPQKVTVADETVDLGEVPLTTK
jgi:hypothetical protein